jgi:hypothetical protein
MSDCQLQLMRSPEPSAHGQRHFASGIVVLSSKGVANVDAVASFVAAVVTMFEMFGASDVVSGTSFCS